MEKKDEEGGQAETGDKEEEKTEGGEEESFHTAIGDETDEKDGGEGAGAKMV